MCCPLHPPVDITRHIEMASCVWCGQECRPFALRCTCNKATIAPISNALQGQLQDTGACLHISFWFPARGAVVCLCHLLLPQSKIPPAAQPTFPAAYSSLLELSNDTCRTHAEGLEQYLNYEGVVLFEGMLRDEYVTEESQGQMEPFPASHKDLWSCGYTKMYLPSQRMWNLLFEECMSPSEDSCKKRS